MTDQNTDTYEGEAHAGRTITDYEGRETILFIQNTLGTVVTPDQALSIWNTLTPEMQVRFFKVYEDSIE